MPKKSDTQSASGSIVKPVLRYDGDCRFCLFWVQYWKHLTGERVTYQPSANLAAAELELPDGSVASGAKAVFQTLAIAGKWAWLWLYETIPGFRPIAELGYRLIAANRGFFYWITRLLWGKEIKPANYFLVRSLFLKFLAIIYLFAFLSFGIQASGLIGSQGILPVQNFLNAAHDQLKNHAYWEVPTIFLINASDAMLHAAAITGIIFAILLLFGILPRTSLIALFLLYLS